MSFKTNYSIFIKRRGGRYLYLQQSTINMNNSYAALFDITKIIITSVQAILQILVCQTITSKQNIIEKGPGISRHRKTDSYEGIRGQVTRSPAPSPQRANPPSLSECFSI